MSNKFDVRQRTMEEMLGASNTTTIHMSELSADPVTSDNITTIHITLSNEPVTSLTDLLEAELVEPVSPVKAEPAPAIEKEEPFQIHGPYPIGVVTCFVLCNEVPCGQPIWPLIIAPNLTPARLNLFGWMCSMEEELLKSDDPLTQYREGEEYVDWLSRYEADASGRMCELMARPLMLPPVATLTHYKALIAELK